MFLKKLQNFSVRMTQISNNNIFHTLLKHVHWIVVVTLKIAHHYIFCFSVVGYRLWNRRKRMFYIRGHRFGMSKWCEMLESSRNIRVNMITVQIFWCANRLVFPDVTVHQVSTAYIAQVERLTALREMLKYVGMEPVLIKTLQMVINVYVIWLVLT